MHHVCLYKGAGYTRNSHVASLYCINDAGYHQDLLRDSGGARLFLCYVIPLYSSVTTASGLDGAVPFLLQEHHIGHCGPATLYADKLWVVWLQGVHHDQLAYLLLKSTESVLTEALQDLLHAILSHDDLRNRA